MTTIMHFDMLRFEPMTFGQWLFRYGGVIRVSMNPSKVSHLPVGMLLCGPAQRLYVPRYGEDRSWRDGYPMQLFPGDKPMLVRVAGLRYRGETIVIEGVHRLLDGPRFIVVDYLDVGEAEHIYFSDLMSPFFAGLIP